MTSDILQRLLTINIMLTKMTLGKWMDWTYILDSAHVSATVTWLWDATWLWDECWHILSYLPQGFNVLFSYTVQVVISTYILHIWTYWHRGEGGKCIPVGIVQWYKWHSLQLKTFLYNRSLNVNNKMLLHFYEGI